MQRFAGQRPASLLPCVDRPIMQHVVEYLVDQGVTEFDFLLQDMPEQVESFLGDGGRWGSRCRFHLVREKTYHALLLPQMAGKDETVLVGHADRIPILANSKSITDAKNAGMFYCTSGLEDKPVWTGWALVDARILALGAEAANEKEFEGCLRQANAESKDTIASVTLDFRSVSGFLEAQRAILNKILNQADLYAREVEPGIWIARNVTLHPKAHLQAPMFVGENSNVGAGVKLGPNAAIGANSVIDRNTTVMDSAVFPGTFCGEGLELDHMIADHSRLMSCESETSIEAPDAFILSGLQQRSTRGLFWSWISRVTAALILILASPLMLVTAMILALVRKGRVFYCRRVVQLPAADAESWRYFNLWSFRDHANAVATGRLKYLLFASLPALPAVVTGRLGFVGVKPRTKEEIEKLPADWQSLYLQATAGLVSEADAVYGGTPTEDELYSSEVYYSTQRGMQHDLRIALRFIFGPRAI